MADLDNTLLYSYKHAREGDLCVEWLKGKEQGYMTKAAFEKLKALQSGGGVIPVTSRSIEQYGRIQLPVLPKYAIVANGGWLLVDGKPDEAWRKVSEAYIFPYLVEFVRLEEALVESEQFIRVRMVDETFLFAYCKDGVEAQEVAGRYAAETPLKVEASGKKVYFFPPMINKGQACMRLRELLGVKNAIAAGDSSIDAPMLSAAEEAVVPKGYPKALIASGVRVHECTDGNFSEFVLKTVEEFFQKNEC